MAELALKIGTVSPDPAYQDGDVLCAFNRRMIRCVHAQHILNPRDAARNSAGLVRNADPLRNWFEATHQYRFERISPSQVRRRTLATNAVETISDNPNERGEYMDVALFVARRRQQPEHCLFGVDGREIWYGGKIDVSDAKIDAVWNAIETKTPFQQANATRWPAGIQDLKSHLFVETDEFDDSAANDLVAPEVDDGDPEQPVVVRRRKHQVDWRNTLSISTADRERILDRTQVVDLRDRGVFDRKTLVALKTRRER